MHEAAIARPGSGTLTLGEHVFPLRVYYEDTDAAGIVYYANYLKFAERARTELLRLVGIEHGTLAFGAGVRFAVRRCQVDYLSPARIDDALEVRSRLTEVRGARVALAQAVWCEGEVLARLVLTIACIRPDGRAVRVPPAVRRALWVAQGIDEPQ
ncbi:MAG: tol-pal system-associated acyl-CoA thioesterase [Alphaproteobacteria bacterium]|nr:tol-pal system-associated acyl-CoA thioesterase [Alphaproteobacteria bacterium]